MMKHLIALTTAILLLSACLSFSTGEQKTAVAEAAFTQAAQTMWAQMTQSAGDTAIAQLTLLADRPTATPPPPMTDTPPPPPTATPQPEAPASPTALPPTATASPIPCDWAELVADVTVPPDALLPVGAHFAKTWRLLNRGACAWTANYALVFSGGDALGGVTMIQLPAVVQPGESIDLTVMLTVPGNPGVYQGNWMLRNAAGAFFGLGASGVDPLFVRVQAYWPSTTGDYDYNFALDFCAAEWQSVAGRLTCPGVSESANGAANLLDRPLMENGRPDSLVLSTRPSAGQNGWINGQFPLYTIRNNDHFMAQIGCLADSSGCDIIFQVGFQIAGGASQNLGSWREVYDGALTNIDIDLSPLSGIAGWFVFTVSHNGVPQAANAAWVNPRIENYPPSAKPVMTWTRQEGDGQCVLMEVYLTSPWTAEARLYPCGNKAIELGRTSLTQDELRRLLDWYRRLGDFDSEIYQASGANPTIVWIYFQGQGSQNATNADITSMNGFGNEIFSRILARSR